MMIDRRILMMFVWVGVTLGLLGTARADNTAEVNALVKKARKAFKSGRCDFAVRQYRQAAALTYSPIFTYRIGQCQEHQKNYQAALGSHQRDLKDIETSPPSKGHPTKMVATARIVRLKLKIKLALSQLALKRREATRLFRLAKCKKAIAVFREIKGAQYHPFVDYRIGQCFEHMKKTKRAIDYYQRYLKAYSAHAVVKGQPSMKAVTARIARLKRSEQAAKVDEDMARAALNRSVALEMADGTVRRGVIQGVSATAIILAKKDGTLVKVPLSDVQRMRVVVARRATRSGGASHLPTGPRPVDGSFNKTQRLMDLKLRMGSANDTRNVGIALTFSGVALYVLGGAMFGVKKCVSAYGISACGMPDGAFVAAIVMFSVASVLELIGVPLWIVYGNRKNHLKDKYENVKWGRTAMPVPRTFRHGALAGTSNSGASFVLSHRFRF